MKKLVTPKIIKPLYILGVVLAGLDALAILVAGVSLGGAGFLAIIIAPLAFVICVVAVRVLLEMAQVLFNMGAEAGAVPADTPVPATEADTAEEEEPKKEEKPKKKAKKKGKTDKEKESEEE